LQRDYIGATPGLKKQVISSSLENLRVGTFPAVCHSGVQRGARLTRIKNGESSMAASFQSQRHGLRTAYYRHYPLAAASILGLSVVTTVSAQTRDSHKMEEVVVTAQKFAERLQDVPVPVTAVTSESLIESGQLSVEDYYTRVPGLNYSVSGEGGQSTIAIRGITTGSDTNPTVGIVIDDIPYGSTIAVGTGYGVSVADIDPGDLERVEVLRGPQGTLYGASSMGGLLKFVTKDPSTESFSGRVQLGSSSVRGGNDFGYSARGSMNVPLSDTLAVRASAYTLEEPGWVDNVETGKRDFNTRESDGGRLSALWRASESFTLKLSALIQDTSRIGTNESDISLGREQFRQRFLPGTGGYDRNVQAYSATMIAKLGDVELTSLTGYSDDELATKTDLTYAIPALMALPQLFFGVDRMFSDNQIETKKLSQELRASMPLGDRVQWLVGGFYTDEDIRMTGTNYAADDGGAVHGLVFQLNYGPQTYKELSAFTTFTVQLADHFDVQLGARYSDTKQTSLGVWRGPQSLLVFGADPRALPRETANDHATTYLFTPRWKINDDTMLYARLASGYRPGGPNNGCGHTGVPCRFDSDTTRNYDLGLKGNIADGLLAYDAAVYFIQWDDIQIPGLYSPDFLFSYTANVSQAQSEGVELSLELRPVDGVRVGAWGAYNDAKLTADFPADQIFLVGRDGDRVPYSARVSGNVYADYQFPFIGSNGSASVGASLSYVGDRMGSFESMFDVRQRYPSYTQLDLTAGVQYDSWAVRLFANNVTDKRAILRGGTDSQFSANFITYIQPRTIGLSLSKTF
jgi:outer membrane receptor protein involved in Fe transport